MNRLATSCITWALLAAVSLLTGCNRSAGPPPAGGGTASAPPGVGPSGSAIGMRIAVVPKGLAYSFWQAVKAGAEKAGQEGGAQILWNGPANEKENERQIAILEGFINQKVDAIVMAATDANALVPTIKKAADAGIPVITIDSGVNSDLPKSLIATDNEKGAAEAAHQLATLIGGTGEVGLLPFIKGAASSDARERGFKEGLKAHPELKLVSTLYTEGQSDVAMRKTEDMLTANPNLGGIFAANEPGAIGAAQVLKTRGKAGKVKLVAFDASPEEIKALEDGTIQALIVQNPFQMGYQGVQAALKVKRGEPVEKRIDTGVAVVTKANMQEPAMQQLLHPTGKG
jgi:ribose transport system substrate-binding protein